MLTRLAPAAFAALLLAASPALADPEAQATALRDAALKGNAAYAIVEALTTEIGPRLAGSAAEARARDWTVARMKALGFQNVRVESFPLEVWERGVETAEVLGPNPQKLAVTALGRSGATPPEGLDAEIVYFASLDALKAAAPGSLAGKIAFIDHRMMPTQDGSSYGPGGAPRRHGPSIAASKGAAAVLIRSAGTDYHRNPHTGGTNWAPGQTPIPAGALSLPDAEQLQRLLARGPVKLRLVLTPRFLGQGSSGNVMGDIPGTVPGEVVVVGGHLDSWDLGTGAIDDGAGVAITMGAAKLILDRVKAGTLPQPRRTIRVVAWGAEEVGVFGGAAYAKAHAAETMVAGESDFGADRIWRLSTNVGPAALPVVAAMNRVLAPLGIAPGPNDSGGGADVQALGKAGAGIVDLDQDGTRYFDLHHTPDDTLDKIDPKQLDQNVAAWAAVIWLAATSDADFRKPAAAAPATR